MGAIIGWLFSEETANNENHDQLVDGPSRSYHVAFLGDSTLDNVSWVEPGEEIAALVRKRGIEVSNLAVDGARSECVLGTAQTMISSSAREAANDPFPEEGPSESFNFSPLNALESRQRKKNIDAVVLSVGGNDIRVLLGQLGGSSDQFILHQAITALVKNYLAIVSRVMEICPNSHLILMTQYIPDYQNDAYGIYRALKKEQLFEMMEKVYNSIIPHLTKHKATVIDLTASFDPRDTSLYVQQIEPSKRGGVIVADLIEHAVKMGESKDMRFLVRTSNGKIMKATGVKRWTACPPSVMEMKGYCGIFRSDL